MAQHIDREAERYGSGGLAEEADLQKSGLYDDDGIPIGHGERRVITLGGDAPMLTIGGARSGKARELLIRALSTSTAQRMFVLDPRGELYAVTWHNFIRSLARAFCWNPIGLHDNPRHRVNPLDILKWGSRTFHGDARFIAEALIPLSGGRESKYFEQRAREWIAALLKSLVERFGWVDFPMLRHTINSIAANGSQWQEQLQAMLDSAMDDVARTAGEILSKQGEAERELQAILGTIYANISFLDDPALLASLEKPHMSLEELATSERPASIFLNVPIEFVSLWSPLLRVMFTVTMLYKARHPQAPRITMITDEAGQLGNFEALLRSFTFGAGAGVRSWAIFQDIGQIIRNFGHEAVQGFMGSAQLRQFFGVRDLQTAEIISRMLGQSTLRYDDTLRQSVAALRKRQAVLDLMNGADPVATMLQYRQSAFAEDEQTKAPRAVLTPDEVLALPEDRQLLFISGKNLKPVLGYKYPYYTQSDLAGYYLPNPYHPPLDRVPVAGRMFRKTARVISEPIPPELATYPQYQSGMARYVGGYRPF